MIFFSLWNLKWACRCSCRCSVNVLATAHTLFLRYYDRRLSQFLCDDISNLHLSHLKLPAFPLHVSLRLKGPVRVFRHWWTTIHVAPPHHRYERTIWDLWSLDPRDSNGGLCPHAMVNFDKNVQGAWACDTDTVVWDINLRQPSCVTKWSCCIITSFGLWV